MAAASPAPAGAGAGVILTPQQSAVAGQLSMAAGRLREYASSTLASRKPWGEVIDRNSFAKPASMQEATSRLRKNLAYFRINYLIVMLLSVAGAFVYHPTSLFALAFLAASWVYVFAIRQGPLNINGRDLSEREKFWAMVVLSFVVVFFLTNVGNVVFSAVMAGGALIGAHGATRVPDDLFLDDSDASTGLLSIFTGGGAPSATVAAAV